MDLDDSSPSECVKLLSPSFGGDGDGVGGERDLDNERLRLSGVCERLRLYMVGEREREWCLDDSDADDDGVRDRDDRERDLDLRCDLDRGGGE